MLDQITNDEKIRLFEIYMQREHFFLSLILTCLAGISFIIFNISITNIRLLLIVELLCCFIGAILFFWTIFAKKFNDILQISDDIFSHFFSLPTGYIRFLKLSTHFVLKIALITLFSHVYLALKGLFSFKTLFILDGIVLGIIGYLTNLLTKKIFLHFDV